MNTRHNDTKSCYRPPITDGVCVSKCFCFMCSQRGRGNGPTLSCNAIRARRFEATVVAPLPWKRVTGVAWRGVARRAHTGQTAALLAVYYLAVNVSL